ncbi:Uncharacterised protein [Lysinibacillus sphaericus]|nr:Uncharacterised protein [Lysinibacillus sphaericus]
MHNKRHPKNLITVRIVATINVLLFLILPFFGLISHGKTPFVILITLFVFYIVESKYGKKTVSE